MQRYCRLFKRRGVAHLKVSGKGGKTLYIPLHPAVGGLILEYLEELRNGTDLGRPPLPAYATTVQGHWERPLPQTWFISWCASIRLR